MPTATRDDVNKEINRLNADPNSEYNTDSMNMLAEAAASSQTVKNPSSFKGCFNPQGTPGFADFDETIKRLEVPSRTSYSINLNGNITSLIVNVGANGKADMLFFNARGQDSDTFELAEPFLKVVQAKFPGGKILQTTEKTPPLRLDSDRKNTGNYSWWFRLEADKMSSKSLGDIANHFQDLLAVPEPQELRKNQTNFLEQYSNKPSSNAHSQQQINPSAGTFNIVNLIARAFQGIKSAFDKLLKDIPGKENYEIKVDQSWSFEVKHTNEDDKRMKIACQKDQRLLATNLDPRDANLMDAYIKSILVMAEGRIAVDNFNLVISHLPVDLAVTMSEAAARNGVHTDKTLAELGITPPVPDSGKNYNLGDSNGLVAVEREEATNRSSFRM